MDIFGTIRIATVIGLSVAKIVSTVMRIKEAKDMGLISHDSKHFNNNNSYPNNQQMYTNTCKPAPQPQPTPAPMPVEQPTVVSEDPFRNSRRNCYYQPHQTTPNMPVNNYYNNYNNRAYVQPQPTPAPMPVVPSIPQQPYYVQQPTYTNPYVVHNNTNNIYQRNDQCVSRRYIGNYGMPSSGPVYQQPLYQYSQPSTPMQNLMSTGQPPVVQTGFFGNRNMRSNLKPSHIDGTNYSKYGYGWGEPDRTSPDLQWATKPMGSVNPVNNNLSYQQDLQQQTQQSRRMQNVQQQPIPNYNQNQQQSQPIPPQSATQTQNSNSQQPQKSRRDPMFNWNNPLLRKTPQQWEKEGIVAMFSDDDGNPLYGPCPAI